MYYDPSRRRLILGTMIAGAGLALNPLRIARADGPGSELTADGALKTLIDGNKRYMAQMLERPHQTAERRQQLVPSQAPFATIVCCSDSRVPPELLYDTGLGDLFVSREAGSIVDDATLGTAEYGVIALGVPLIVVLGHDECGAVKAAVDVVKTGTPPPGHINALTDPILPAVRRAQAVQGLGGDLVDLSVSANIGLMVERLINSSLIINDAVRNGRARVVGMRYNLKSGEAALIVH